MSLQAATEPFTGATLPRSWTPPAPHRQPEKRGLRVGGVNPMPILGAIIFSLTIVATTVYFREALTGMGNWGYLGNFVAQMASSSTVVIPIPAGVLTLAMGSTLNPLLLGLAAGAGAAIGELSAYLIGASGGMFNQGRLCRRMRALTTRWGGPTLFAFASCPSPLTWPASGQE